MTPSASKFLASLSPAARRSVAAQLQRPVPRYPVPPVAAKKRRAKNGDGQSGLEKTFFSRWTLAGGERPKTQFRFHPTRWWRFDFAWPMDLWALGGRGGVAVEVQGGVWAGMGHTRGNGYQRDREKMREAQRLGWIIFELTSKDMEFEQMERIAEEIFKRRLAAQEQS